MVWNGLAVDVDRTHRIGVQHAVQLVGGAFQQYDQSVHLGTSRSGARHTTEEHHYHKDNGDKFVTSFVIKCGETG